MNIDTSVVGITIPQGAVKNIASGGTTLWRKPEADLFVANYGSDTTGDGSLARPYKTVSAALAASSDGDVIMLLTDTEDNFNGYIYQRKTLCAINKDVVFFNHSFIRLTSGTDFTMRDLTFSSDMIAPHSSSYGCLWPQLDSKLLIDNVRFTNCKTVRLSGADNRASIIVADSSSANAVLRVRNCSIDNSETYAFVVYRDQMKGTGEIENIVCGENCHFYGWLNAEIYQSNMINLGWNGLYRIQKISGIHLRDGASIGTSYFTDTDIPIDNITGDGAIKILFYGTGTAILSEIYITGSINCEKRVYINGAMRGTLTIVDNYRAAADGNVMFSGYGGYTITQEDLSHMTWGGAEGFHLSLENNQIVLRAD